MPVDAEVSIVGGGVMGLFLAVELRRRGAQRVSLIEKRFCGAGSSGKSGAICRQHYSNEVTAGLARDSLGAYSTFPERFGGSAGFVRTGCLFLSSRDHARTMEQNVDLQRSWGINTRMVSLDDCRDLEPHLDLSDQPAACYEPDTGCCDPMDVLQTLEALALHLGVELVEGERVSTIDTAKGSVRGVTLESGRQIASDVVVNCAGPWAAALARTAGVDLPIRASKPQIAFTRRPVAFGGAQRSHVTVCDLVHQYYTRPFFAGQTLMGGLDMEQDPVIEDPDLEEEGIDDQVVAELNRRLVQRFPIMQRGRSMGGMGALYAITPDYHAIIGPESKARGLYTCAGFSGHGFKMAPEIGRELACHITTGSYDRHDMGIFRSGRFADDQPVRGRYEYSILG